MSAQFEIRTGSTVVTGVAAEVDSTRFAERSLVRKLSELLIEAKSSGFVIEVTQRIDPLNVKGAVAVGTVRRARGFY